MNGWSYYYDQMTEDEKLAYRIICDGLHRHKEAIKVMIYPEMKLKYPTYIYDKVLDDNPIFFYVNRYCVRHTQQNCELTIYPKYLYSFTEARMMIEKIHNAADPVIQRALEYKNDPFKMELFLHNSVVKSVAYDYEAAARAGEGHNAHSIIGTFIDTKAVCDGISRAFKLLCDSVGLPCLVVAGYADDKGIFPKDSLHAWNLVNIDGQWYHVDVTWDAMELIYSGGKQSEHHFMFDYFNLTTEDIAVDHRPMEPIPLCTAKEDNYFYRRGKYANTYDDMLRIIEQQIDSDKIRIRIDCGESAVEINGAKQKQLVTGNFENRILDALHEVQRKRKTTHRYSYYWNERIGVMNLYKI